MKPKFTQTLSRDELKSVLAVARGESCADLLIKNCKILDLVSGGINDSAIIIVGSTIAGIGLEYLDANAKEVIDAKGQFVVPGFIDGHVHIESSMMHPFEFESMTLPLGTTTCICDPHEITNVLGQDGFAWFIRCSELMQQNLFVQVSSCVPALPGVETNGAPFELEDMLPFKNHPHVLGLAEMMNFPGVINADEKVLDKLEAFSGMALDGHCPLLRGKELNAYIAAGISNCHETVTMEEGQEKLEKGMALIIREGSVAKNLKTLAPLVSEYNSSQCFLCTDDRNPFEILNEGHINYMIKRLIKDSAIPVHVAYRLASFSAAKHFGLKRLGLIAPGMRADMVLLSNLDNVAIESVYKSGKLVDAKDLQQNSVRKFKQSQAPTQNTIKRELTTTNDFSLELKIGTYNTIGVIAEEIITEHLKTHYDGERFDAADVLQISVVERYGHQAAIAHGSVKGIGITGGAIASSVAHDSHNIIVIGDNAVDISLAVNTLIKSGGGFCVTSQGQLTASLPLNIAGLMSSEPHLNIAAGITTLKTAYANLGGSLKEPFLQMAFLALPVIPCLKITDQGLFNVSTFQKVDHFTKEEKS